MKILSVYFKALLVVLYIVANYYGFKYGFVALNYPKDAAFIAGFVGVTALVVTGVLVITHVVRKYLPKDKTETNETK